MCSVVKVYKEVRIRKKRRKKKKRRYFALGRTAACLASPFSKQNYTDSCSFREQTFPNPMIFFISSIVYGQVEMSVCEIKLTESVK